nr:RecName: Full=IgW chain C region, secreted form 2 [Heterodontus francisci]
VISGFYPDSVQVSWKKDRVDQSGVVLHSKQRNDSTFETVSYLTVPVVEWTTGDVYTCEVSHTGSRFNDRISMRYQKGGTVNLPVPGGNTPCTCPPSSCSGCMPKLVYQTDLNVTLENGGQLQYNCHQQACKIK